MTRLSRTFAIALAGILIAANLSAQGTDYIRHTVQHGETLYRLAANNGISVKDLYDANPELADQGLKAGSVIRIPVNGENGKNVSGASQEEQALTKTDLIRTPMHTDNYRTTHKVARKETIYRICRNYGITEEEFLDANPEFRYAKLKPGAVVNIPYNKQQKAEQILHSYNTVDAADPDFKDKVMDMLGESTHGRKTRNDGVVRAALVIPFMLDRPQDTEQKKMVEFYQGVLLAIEELKANGTSVELRVIDSGSAESPAGGIFSDELTDMDIIFGPRFDNHIDVASDFAVENRIPLVLPFSSSSQEVLTNPYIYKLNTEPEQYMSQVYDHFFRQFINPKVIIFSSTGGSGSIFTRGLRPELEKRGIEYVDMKVDTASANILANLSLGRQNIYVIDDASLSPLLTMLPVLQLVERSKDPDIQTCLFGYPEYQIYASDHLEEFYEIDTFFYTWFYTNNILPASLEFGNRFRRSFSRQMMTSYPSFAAYGYDMASYFLKGIARYGDRMGEHLESIRTNPVQMGFKFIKASENGGYTNKKIFFVHLSDEYSVTKIDFDR